MSSNNTRTGTTLPSNAAFAYDDRSFNRWCLAAGVIATKRQASKWRRGMGAAYKTMKGVIPPKVKETA